MDALSRICPQCSVPLAQNETYCSYCGARYTEQTAIGPSASPVSVEQSYSPPSLPDSEYGQPSSPIPIMLFDAPEADGQQSPARRGRFIRPPLSRIGPKFALIIGVSALLLLVIGGGLFFLVKSRGSNTSVLSNGTPTHTKNDITATPTPVPLFSDDFADNSRGWGLASGSGYSSTIRNNMMTLADANHKILNMPVPAGNKVPASFGDFEVTTTLTLSKADQNDSAGLYIRGNSNLVQGYFIDIFGDNSFDIVKIFADSSKDAFLVSPTNSSSINPIGRQNTLTVVTKGSKIVVLINGKVVSSISDNNDYTSGTIELFVENGLSSNGAQASFSHVTVYPAPEQLPSN
jgi:hypothetical protein